MTYSEAPAVEDKSQTREKVVIQDRCKGCGFCVAFCPRQALRLSAQFNKKGYHYPEVDHERCVHCGLCDALCPEFAIYSPENKGQKPGKAGR